MTPTDLCIQAFGCPPGPGVDILIHATNPVSQEWGLEGMTEAGQAYLNYHYPSGKIHGARWVANLKGWLANYGMTHETIFPEVAQRIGEP